MTDSGLVVPYFTSLLSAIGSRVLAEIVVTGTHFHTLPEDIGPCIQALSSPRFSLSLRIIKLHFSFARFHHIHLDAFSFHDTFSPLLHARHIRVLSLSVGQSFLSISDADLDQIAQAWKDVVVLRLGHGRMDMFGSASNTLTSVKTFTVGALVGLAERCTKLVHLQCDMAEIVEQDARELTDLCNARKWSVQRWQWLAKIETNRARGH